jgi:hypothetical protein
MVRVLVAVAIVALAAGVAALVNRRRRADPPTQPRGAVPSQLDRRDFCEPTIPWLVAVFSSETCHTCADVIAKAEVLRSDDVAVDIVPFQTRRDVHQRYAIDAVPCLVVADATGAVQASFLGPVTATDLWAAVARARQPGSIDQTCCDTAEGSASDEADAARGGSEADDEPAT